MSVNVSVKVSEVDENGHLLASFPETDSPQHLSANCSGGRVLVADQYHDRVLLLNSKLSLERVLVVADSQVELQRPERIHYSELTSQLYVLHSSRQQFQGSDVISQFSLRWLTHDCSTLELTLCLQKFSLTHWTLTISFTATDTLTTSYLRILFASL